MTELLDVRDLHVSFPIRGGPLFRPRRRFMAVDGVTFSIPPGGTFALVGESGSGKTTVARAILRLYQDVSGDVRYGPDRLDVLRLSGRELQSYRQQVQPVFQDPFSSLDPRMQAVEIVGEPLRVAGVSRTARLAAARDLLRRVGIQASADRAYPHEFSGGQRQRIAIARALILRPRLIILDEPVSSLDVSIRAQVLNLLIDLQEEFATSYLMIAHDLALVRSMSQRIGIMYHGRIVELGPTDEVLRAGQHPYTRLLLDSARWASGSDLTSLAAPEEVEAQPVEHGCAFRGRCVYAAARCETEDPLLAGDDHRVACHFPLPSGPADPRADIGADA